MGAGAGRGAGLVTDGFGVVRVGFVVVLRDGCCCAGVLVASPLVRAGAMITFIASDTDERPREEEGERRPLLISFRDALMVFLDTSLGTTASTGVVILNCFTTRGPCTAMACSASRSD